MKKKSLVLRKEDWTPIEKVKNLDDMAYLTIGSPWMNEIIIFLYNILQNKGSLLLFGALSSEPFKVSLISLIMSVIKVAKNWHHLHYHSWARKYNNSINLLILWIYKSRHVFGMIVDFHSMIFKSFLWCLIS